ncbi:MAG: 4a-hydroxytetrahydrobiopterin dehydratase [Serpentinimonas sp.]|nr:4a-hydroxytetrahydrobiopterin dehydratase [Serpentinimonas sp.]
MMEPTALESSKESARDAALSAAPGWQWSERPPSLFRRFQFGSYGQTRQFLDRLAEQSAALGVEPQNINFGTTYVNVTISAIGPNLSESECRLAAELSRLATA